MNLECPLCYSVCQEIPALEVYACIDDACMLNGKISRFEYSVAKKDIEYMAYYDLIMLKNNIYYTLTYNTAIIEDTEEVRGDIYHLSVYEAGSTDYIFHKTVEGPITPEQAVEVLNDVKNRFDKIRAFL